jgi:hypothetical protein
VTSLATQIKTLPGRHCVCRTSQAQPPRSPRAERAAEHAAALGVDLATCSLREAVGDRQLLDDLSTMDLVGLCRVCGWPRTGRRLDAGGGGWAS